MSLIKPDELLKTEEERLQEAVERRRKMYGTHLEVSKRIFDEEARKEREWRKRHPILAALFG